MDSESINERPIPIGLRYIAYDQWLLTHIQPSWKISHIKLFILSKCLRTNYTVPPNPFSRRDPSPITFAPLNPIHGRPKTTPLPEDGYEEDDEYNSDTEDDHDDPNASKPFSYRPSSARSARTVTAAVPSPPPAAYTLIRFSTGQILEDSFQFSAYDISPYELLELHGEHSKSMTKPVFPPRRNSLPRSQTPPPSPPPSSTSPTRLIRRIVCLNRTDIQAYVAPYWEGWVKALRVVNRDDLDLAMRSQAAHQSHHHHRRTGTPSTSGASTTVTDRDASNIFGGMSWAFGGVGVMGGMGAGFGVVLDDEVLKLRDEDVVVPSGKKKSSKLASKVKLEWKERWVVVQGDALYICKDREDVNPSQRIPLSSLVNIQDKDFLLSYPTPATSPFVPTSPPVSDPDIDKSIFDSPPPRKKGKDKLNNHTKYVVCARFRSNDNEDHYHRGRGSTRADESGLKTAKTKNKNKEKDKEKAKVKDGKDKSQQKKQKQRYQGSNYGDLSYYSPVAIAAATGVVLPLPSSATGYSSSPEHRVTSKREEKQRSEDDYDHDHGFDTPGITRPGTAVSRSETEDIYTSPIPTGDDTHDEEGTLSHLQQHQGPLSGISCTTAITGLSSANLLSQSDTMPSPLFAHTSESEWEKDIFGQPERRKQPFYHTGYEPAFRWKESGEYDRARDVWEEEQAERKKGKGKGRERGKDSRRSSHHQHEWIILDLCASSAFNSMLRVLHRGAPSASSTFKNKYLPKENDPPELVVGSSSPIRRGRPTSSAAATGVDDIDEYSDSSTRRHGFDYNDDDTKDRHEPQSPPPSRNLPAWNERLGVMPYPEWRIKITKRAQRAALGNISNAMLFYLFRSLEFADLSSPGATTSLDGARNVKNPMERSKSQKSKRSQRSQRLRTASAASTVTVGSTSAQPQALESSSKSSIHSDDISSSHFELDIGSSSDESSEMEWHGWILDISRQYQAQQQRHQKWRERSVLGGGGGSGKVAGEKTPTADSSPRPVRVELDDSYGYEAMRRKALEPSGTVSTMATTVVSPRDIIRPSSSHHIERRKLTEPPRSPVDDRDGGGGQPRLSSLPLLPSSISSSRSVGSPPFSSPEPPSSPPPPPSLAAARNRLTSMKTNNILKSSDVPSHLISRRRPSMPQLSFEHPSTSSDLIESASSKRHIPAVEHAGRRGFKGSSPPDVFGDMFSSPSSAGAGSSRDGTSGGNTSKSSQFIRRRASAAGLITSNLAGSFGRSANFIIGGLWRKEKDGKEKDKDKDTPRESAQGSLDEQREYNNNKKGKGKGTNNIIPRPGSSSREGGSGMARSLSPSAVGSSVIIVSRATSGSSFAATSPEDNEDELPGPSPMAGTKGERWKSKKGHLVYEMEKIAKGFDGD